MKLLAEACNFIEKEIWRKCFLVTFCGISQNTFPYRTPPVVASNSPPSLRDNLYVTGLKYVASMKFL